DSADYMLINRGSQIIADGSPVAPITLTGFSDAVTGTAGAEDVQLWGGVVINGNGITNNCSDAQRDADDCHVVSEGQPSNYGGSDNMDSSGILRYVVVKHTGFEVAPGDELNGITFNAVGAGTTVENLEVYSTFDDGIEFFGGAVNITRFLALYVRDDSIDFSDGWVGSIDQALVIHQLTDGNRCVEGDNIGSGRADAGESLDTAPVSNPTISGLTCILSNQPSGTHDPSEGIVLRRGPQAQFVDGIVFGGYADDVDEDNECFEIDDGTTRDFAQNGDTTMNQFLIACEDPTKDALGNGDDIEEWVLGANPSTNGADYSFNVGNQIIFDPMNANVVVLDLFYSPETDGMGNVTVTDEMGNMITLTPESGQLGAVTRSDDWLAGWTFGLFESNRAQPLWFE
ncbi:MAG: serine/threonine protein kinase, partial [Pseudomonadota bacterium]